MKHFLLFCEHIKSASRLGWNRSGFWQVLSFGLFWIILLSTAHAQKLPIRRYNVDEGLASNSVVTIYQDRQGYLWIATYGGLSRFDGKSFKNYHPQNSNLGGSLIKAITEDAQGRLWIGYTGGIAQFDPTTEVFINYSVNEGLIGPSVIRIWPHPQEGLWISTQEGISFFDGIAFKGYPIPAQDLEIAEIEGTTDGQTVYLTAKEGIYRWTAQHQEFVKVPEVAIQVRWMRYHASEEALYLAGTQALFRLKGQEFTKIAESPLGDELDFFTWNRNSSDSAFWISSHSAIWRWKDGENLVYTAEELGSPYLYRVLPDREGNIWFAGENGIGMIIDDRLRVYQENLPGEIITSFAQDAQGSLWVGGIKGVAQLSTTGLIQQKHDLGYVGTLWSEGEQIWATGDQGLTLFRPQQSPQQWFNGQMSGASILKDRLGKYWLGSYNGLYSTVPELWPLNLELDTSSGLGSQNVYVLWEDQQGAIWVGTENGLSRWQDEKWRHFTIKEGLPSNSIWDIIEHPDWGLLIGTQQGLVRWDGQRFEEIPVLQDHLIYTLTVDPRGKLWVGTGSGVYRLNQQLQTEIFLDKSRGLTGNNIWNHARLGDQQHLYLGTYNGFNRIDWEIQPKLQAQPLLDFHQVAINQHYYGLSRLEQPLEHRENNLTFSFNAVYMYLPQSVMYRYYLEGLEDDWNAPTSHNKAVYTTLPPGDYTFHVQVLAEDGKQSSPQSLRFSITEPFWWRWWFLGLEALVVLALFWFVVRFFVRQSMLKAEEEKRVLQAQKEQSDALYQKQLQLDKMKDEFLANTSHELRTPLNGIIGLSESLLEGAAGPVTQEQRGNLSLIVQSGKRLANLISDLLDFSKMKNQELQLQLRPIDIHSIAEIVIAFSKPLIGQKAITLYNDLYENLPLVQADENRLQQILFNLVGNAIKFTHEGQVRLSAHQEGEFLVMTIADTGIGIPSTLHEKIFQPFEQGDGSTAREYGGTGLGLSVTRQLIELHGGKVWLESQPQRGSTFFFSLPLAADQTRRATDSAKPLASILDAELMASLSVEPAGSPSTLPEIGVAPQPLPKENAPLQEKVILIVDDEPVNIQVLKNHLQLQGYRVLPAQDAFQALSILENRLPDLILLDLMMPRMNGYELCQKIRETYPPSQLPIVMLTAKNQTEDLVQGLNSGANDYLIKPFNRDELLTRVKSHLNLSHSTRAYARFVPQEFLELLNKESIIDVALGDCVKKRMTILFSDIRSFTSLSESMSPEENFNFLNSYLQRMEPLILHHGGFIDKYIGDAIMALFPASADEALQAAIAMLKTLDIYNEHRKNMGYKPVRIGIGLNTGDLMLGTIGGHQRMEGTVISDSVNLASRIEGMTKHYGVPLLISEHTVYQLKDPSFYAMRFIDRVKVKGKNDAVSIYEVFQSDSPPQREAKSASKITFEKAWLAYQHQQFQEAQRLFQECLTLNPQDQPAQLYIERCQYLMTVGIQESWNGVIDLESK